MRVKKEVDIILMIVFIILFVGLGSYIAVKDMRGEKVIDPQVISSKSHYILNAIKGSKDIAPRIEPEEVEEPVSKEPDLRIIEIKDTGFYPSEFNISVGTTVLWVNKDAKRNYKVYEKSTIQMFNSFRLEPYESFEYTFNESGVYYFNDAVFTYMKGVIRVVD